MAASFTPSQRRTSEATFGAYRSYGYDRAADGDDPSAKKRGRGRPRGSGKGKKGGKCGEHVKTSRGTDRKAGSRKPSRRLLPDHVTKGKGIAPSSGYNNSRVGAATPSYKSSSEIFRDCSELI
jgi:hypothetical protein